MPAAVLRSPEANGADAWMYLAHVAQHMLDGACFMHSDDRTDQAAAIDALDYLSTRLLSGTHQCSALRPPTTPRLCKLDSDMEAVCDMLSRSELAARDVRLSLTSEPIVLPALRSWQTCLLVAELVREAALEAGVTSIWVKIFTVDDEIGCAVIHDGAGSPCSTTMINTLAAQMGGQIAYRSNASGSGAILSFRRDADSKDL
jgi:hypothetical protein